MVSIYCVGASVALKIVANTLKKTELKLFSALHLAATLLIRTYSAAQAACPINKNESVYAARYGHI